MPSIFNNENSCWGIKRQICDVFHYEINDEDTNSRKLTECVPNSNSLGLGIGLVSSRSNNSIQYSVSSDGYYGYHPHSANAVQALEDTVMDVEENPAEPSFVQTGNVNYFGLNPQNLNGRRKRQMIEDFRVDSKKIKNEEAQPVEPEQQSVLQEKPCKEYFSHPKCVMGHYC